MSLSKSSVAISDRMMIEQMLIGYRNKRNETFILNRSREQITFFPKRLSRTDEQMNGETDWRIDGQTVIVNNSTALLQKNINLERKTRGIKKSNFVA